MIERMTAEQESQMAPFAKSVIEKALGGKVRTDIQKATAFMEWVYGKAGLPKPVVIVVDSPLAAQYAANMLTCDKSQVWAQVWAHVGDQVRDQVGDQALKWFDFGYYCDYSDLGWVSFHVFMRDVLGVAVPEDFNRFSEILDLGIFMSIQLKGACIIVEPPTRVVRNGAGRLHGIDCPAVEFRDGYAQYWWNGRSVPEKLIMRPEEVTREDIASEKNAEVRRAYMQKLGVASYYEILGGTDGLRLIDEDVDGCGHMMRLFEVGFDDDLLKKRVRYLEVVCPSTLRVYSLCPPDQKATNVFAAKASMWSEKIKYRQGDVGIVVQGFNGERPIWES